MDFFHKETSMLADQIKIYFYQICANPWCSLEDFPGMIDARDE